MNRPIEYENLLTIGSFKEAVGSREAVEQFIRTASEMQETASSTRYATVRFKTAYEGMFDVVMAVLEAYDVRPGDAGGHRTTAIGRVAADLKLDHSKQSAVMRLHDARNRVTYRKNVPPVTKADADAMLSVLNEMLEAAKQLLSIV